MRHHPGQHHSVSIGDHRRHRVAGKLLEQALQDRLRRPDEWDVQVGVLEVRGIKGAGVHIVLHRPLPRGDHERPDVLRVLGDFHVTLSGCCQRSSLVMFRNVRALLPRDVDWFSCRSSLEQVDRSATCDVSHIETSS